MQEDQTTIFNEQQVALQQIFDKVDLSKIAFVGGIADYINLRAFYEMPIHDIDLIYKNEEDLKKLVNLNEVGRYQSRFYKKHTSQVLVHEFKVNNKSVHADFFQHQFNNIKLKQSMLLGKMVWHCSFEEMQQFHNSQLEKLTSEAAKQDYEWRRLYKHSKKASLYNNITYLKEEGLLDTLKPTN